MDTLKETVNLEGNPNDLSHFFKCGHCCVNNGTWCKHEEVLLTL